MNRTDLATDDAFGPFVESLSHQLFDFTLLFEQSIFSIGPSVILLLVAPLRFLYLSQARQVVRSSSLITIKLVSFAILSIIQCVNLALWTTTAHWRTRASTAAATLALAASLALAGLSYMEHVRSIKPSAIINAYFLFTLPLDFAQVRTLWLRNSDTAVAACFTTASAIKVGLLILEAVEKGRILLPGYKSSPPEATSGVYSRSVFWWLNPLFLTGHRNVLSNDTLLDIDDALATDRVYNQFQNSWSKQSGTGGKYALVWAMTLFTWLQLAATVTPRLVVIFLRFMQPLLIRKVSAWVSEPMTKFTTNEGRGLTGAFGLVYGGLAITSAIYYHQVYRTITMIRGAFVAAIYSKTMELSATAFKESAAVTLMSTDVQKICDALAQFHEVWASVIEIAIATWLLSQQIGYALLGPLLVTVASVMATMVASRYMGPAMGSWMAAVQTRIDATSKVLESMKEIKMLGITPTIAIMLRKLRNNEITISLKSRRLLAGCITLGNVSSALGPGMAFIIYVTASRIEGETLDVPRAFATLSLISLLSGPVSMLIFSFPPLLEALACVQRIQKYLVSQERIDDRLIHGARRSMGAISERPTGMASYDVELGSIRPKTDTRHPDQPSVRLESVSFAWTQEGPPAINEVSVDFPQHSVTFIIGPVGCGKSTLLKGVLGEARPRTGTVRVWATNAAYVDQSSWIQNDTLRNNILGAGVYDDEWYRTITHDCALDEDIASLSQGDLTVVGSAGSSLSGGQKLRVALARAVYSRCDLLILDDCFSGIDAKTEDIIFTRLFGRSGLLRQLGTTVLLATHAAHRLSYSDRIIALSRDGALAEEGTFAALMSKGGYVASLVVRHRAEDEGKADPDNDAAPSDRGKQPQQHATENASSLPKRVMGDRQVYKHYFGAAGWAKSGLFFILIFAFAFFTRFSDFWMVLWTSAIKEHGNSVNGTYLGVFVAFGVITLVSVLGVALQVLTYMVPTSAQTLHERLLTTVFSAPLHFFTSTHTGQTINRFSQDLSLVDSELPMSLIQVTGPMFLALIQVVFISISAAYFAAVLPVVIGVLYLLQHYYLRTSKQIRLLDIEAKAPLFSHFLETIHGLVTIRAFGWKEDFAERQTTLLDKSQKPFYLMYCIQRWLALVLDLIVAALAVIFMVMIVKLRGRLDPGFIALALLNIMSLNNNLTAIIQMWTGLESSMGAIARLKDFDSSTPSEAGPHSDAEVPPPSWPASGAIKFTGFSASYAPDSPNVLHKIDLSIRPGERIGICGATGSSKSSLVASLFRMLSITEGSITIDGIDISMLPPQTVRERIIAIPQAVFLLNNSSIRANIDPLSQSSNAQIEDALREVGLLDVLVPLFPSSSTDGSIDLDIDTPINLAQTLSQGQKQLFGLARALVHPETRVVVMDEVSASVDVQTEELMQRVIQDRFVGKGKTLVVVAHRLGTIRGFDRVVVLDGGRVVEVGEPGELLEGSGGEGEGAGRGSGWFRRLWEA